MDLSTNESAPWLQGLAHMFYLVTPSTTVYKTKEEVPLFFRQVLITCITNSFLLSIIWFLEIRFTCSKDLIFSLIIKPRYL